MAKSANNPQESGAKTQWDAALKNFSQKLYNRAMLNLREAIKLDRSYLREGHKQLETYFRTNQPEKAVAVGLAIIVFEPKNSQLMNNIGNAYRRMGLFKKAMKVYQGALKANPKFVHARYNMAACQFKVSALDGALVRQTRLVEKFSIYHRRTYQLQYTDTIPCFENQPYLKSSVPEEPLAIQEADVEGAELWINQFEEQAKLHPQSWQHQFDLAVLYDVARFGELCLKRYQIAAQLSPQNTTIETNWGIAFSEYQGNYERAKELFLGILKRERCERITVLNLAILYRKMKKPFSTLKYFAYLGELLIKSHGLFHIEEIIHNADLSFQNGERDKAIDLYEALIQERDDPEWHFRLGELYKQKRKFKTAIAFWQKAIQLDSAHQSAHQALEDYVGQMSTEAQQLVDDNFLSDAASLLELAISIYPQIETCEILADIYDELGETELSDQFALQAKTLGDTLNE